jgi:hypothetical protein
VCRAYSRPDVAYRLLQLRLRRAGNQTRALQSSQGRRPRSPSFSSTCHALSLAEAVTLGEPRSVRPSQPQCWFLSVTRACPTVMPNRTPHLRRLAPAEHSEDQRARVEGPSEGRVPWRHATISRACVGCMRFVAHADGVPLLGVLRTSAVVGASSSAGGNPRKATDRPRPSFQRRPAKGAAFQKTRMPFTATPREGFILARRDCSLRPSRRLSRSRRPHFGPDRDSAFDWALRGHGAVTRFSVTGSRVQTPF